jgi:D-glycero-D-manno-heptose 1,7-bisphosphate phosphatase
VTETSIPLRPTIFLDRDGVIIENRAEYVRSLDEVAFIPSALRALAEIAASDYAIVVVTNQAGVGKGLVSAEMVESIHERLRSEIERAGGRVDAIYFCPHTDADECDCRKPKPGLLLRAARDHGLDLSRSWMIGDALTDLQAGEMAGARSLLVLTGRGEEQKAMHRLDGFADLAEALAYIRHGTRGVGSASPPPLVTG